MAYVSWETKRQAQRIGDENRALQREKIASDERVGMAQALASMGPAEMPSVGPGNLPVGGGGGSPPTDNSATLGSSTSPGISSNMQHTLDLAAQAGSQPMGADFAKNVGLAGYVRGPDWNTPNMTKIARPTIEQKILGYAGGGPVRGPQGRDMVPAELPDGSPARLDNGEYVTPREEVIALAREVLGEQAQGLSDDELNEIGLQLLSEQTEQVTGKEPGPEVVPPLLGQSRGMVPGMGSGSGQALSKEEQDWANYKKSEERKDWLANPVPGAVQKTVSGAGGFIRGLVESRPKVWKRDGPAAYDIAQPTEVTASGGMTFPDAGTVERQAPQVARPVTTRVKEPEYSPLPAQPKVVEQPTEQQLLDQITPPGARLTRNGRIFIYEDPMATHPGRAVDNSQVVTPGQSIRGSVRNFPVVAGWEAPNGRTSLAMAAKRDHTYDHLPISGVTLSDSIEGTRLGQVRSPDVSKAGELEKLYEKQAVERATRQKELGLPKIAQMLINQPAVTEAGRATQIKQMREADAADAVNAANAPARAKMEMEAFKQYPKIARLQFDQEKDRREQRKAFTEEFTTPDKSFPIQQGAEIAASIAEKHNVPYSQVKLFMDTLIDSAVGKPGDRDWMSKNPETGMTPLEELQARLDAIIYERTQ